MDELDLAILRTVQEEFPLARRPYETLGSTLGVPPREGFRRVGVLRRIGPLFNSRKPRRARRRGARGTSPHAVEPLAELLRRRTEVTHNYLRDGRFNVWFTVLAARMSDVERVLGDARALAQASGVTEHVALETLRELKKVPPRYS